MCGSSVGAAHTEVEVGCGLRGLVGVSDGVSCFFQNLFHAVAAHIADAAFANYVDEAGEFYGVFTFYDLLRGRVYGIRLCLTAKNGARDE